MPDDILDLFAADELGELDAAVLALVADVPAADPPPQVRQHLLDRLTHLPRPTPTLDEQREAAERLPGLSFAFQAEAVFRYSHLPGVTARVLHLDPATKRFSAVVRLEPGSRIPPHPDGGREECLVLDGELIVGDVRLRAGDYLSADPGGDRVEQWTDVGATVFVSGPMSLLAG